MLDNSIFLLISSNLMPHVFCFGIAFFGHCVHAKNDFDKKTEQKGTINDQLRFWLFREGTTKNPIRRRNTATHRPEKVILNHAISVLYVQLFIGQSGFMRKCPPNHSKAVRVISFLQRSIILLRSMNNKYINYYTIRANLRQ